MGIIQRPTRLTPQDVSSESREAVSAVGSAVNTFMEETYITIMGNLTIKDNLDMEYATFKVTVDSSGIPISPVRFKTGVSRAKGGLVVNISKAVPLSTPFVAFTESNGVGTVSYITGLAPNTEYQLTLLILGA